MTVHLRPLPSQPDQPPALVSPQDNWAALPVSDGQRAVPENGPAQRVQPHDFAALVDRLAAARETVQAPTLSISLAHRDFGPIQVSFRHAEDGVLAVSLASTDPEFSRIAAQAAPPIVSVGEAQASNADHSRATMRSETGSGNGNGSPGNGHRSQNGERRADLLNRSARDDRRPAATRQGDIFA